MDNMDVDMIAERPAKQMKLFHHVGPPEAAQGEDAPPEEATVEGEHWEWFNGEWWQWFNGEWWTPVVYTYWLPRRPSEQCTESSFEIQECTCNE